MKLSFKDIKAGLKQPAARPVRPLSEQFENFVVGEISLDQYSLAPELWLIPDYISQSIEESVLKNGVYTQPMSRWVKLRNRSLQMWGGQVTQSGLEDHEPLPRFLDIFAQRLFDERIFPLKPNHVLINEYQPGDGIMPHTDGDAYYPLVSIVSLGGPTTFTFWEKEPRKPLFSLIVPNRSMLLFTGDLYYNKLHGIDSTPSDQFFSDSCGSVYTLAEDQLSPVLNFSGSLSQVSEPLREPCPRSEGDLEPLGVLYRATRVSFTIRYVPLSS